MWSSARYIQPPEQRHSPALALTCMSELLWQPQQSLWKPLQLRRPQVMNQRRTVPSLQLDKRSPPSATWTKLWFDVLRHSCECALLLFTREANACMLADPCLFPGSSTCAAGCIIHSPCLTNSHVQEFAAIKPSQSPATGLTIA